MGDVAAGKANVEVWTNYRTDDVRYERQQVNVRDDDALVVFQLEKGRRQQPLADAQLALPFLVLAIGLIAVVGPSLGVLIVLAGVSGWTAYARVTRGLVLGLLEQEFVLAARALGASTPRLLLRHVSPNLISTVAVLATLQLASVILLESTLSFLGLGVAEPTPR